MDQIGVTTLILRPKEDAEKTVEQLNTLGIRSSVSPLLSVIPCPDSVSIWRQCSKDKIQSLIITSANAIRMFADISDVRDISVITIGDSSAEIAKNLGFSSVQSAGGDVEALKSLVLKCCSKTEGKLVYLCGKVITEDITKFFIDKGYQAESIEVYDALPVKKLDPIIIDEIKSGTIKTIMFYSNRTAEIFMQIAKDASFLKKLKEISAFCISEKVAGTVKSSEWDKIHVAKTPNGDAVLQLLTEYVTKNREDDFLEEEIELKKIEIVEKDASQPLDNTSSASVVKNRKNSKKAQQTKSKNGKRLNTQHMVESTLENEADKQNSNTSHVVPDHSTLVMLLVLTWIILGGGSGYALYVWQRSVTELQNHENRILGLEKVTENIPYDSHLVDDSEEDKLTFLSNKVTELETKLLAGGVSIQQAENHQAKEQQTLEEVFEAVAIQAQLQEISSRVNDIEGTLRSRISVSLYHSEILISLLELRKAIQAGKPFSDELKKALDASSNEASVSLLLKQLEPYAENGIKNIESLRKEFVDLISDVTKAAIKDEAVDEATSSFKKTLNNLVTVRRVGNVEGDEIDAIIARAEIALQHGYMQDVVTELEKLEGKPALIIGLWLSDAKAIIKVQQVYDQIHRHITEENIKVREAHEADQQDAASDIE